MQDEQRERGLELPQCISCGYALIGLPDDRCPECGQRFVISDSSTYTTEQIRIHNRRKRIWLLVVASPISLWLLGSAVFSSDPVCFNANLVAPYVLGAVLGYSGDRRTYMICLIAVIACTIFVLYCLTDFMYVFGTTSFLGNSDYWIGWALLYVTVAFSIAGSLAWLAQKFLSKSRIESGLFCPAIEFSEEELKR